MPRDSHRTAATQRAATTNPRNDPFLNVPDVATYMGTSERYVRELIAHERLETFRPGRRVLVRRSAADEFIAAHTTPAGPRSRRVGTR